MIDLHTHSSCSDGQLSPDLLCARAIEAGLGVISLTDHDTLEGLALLHKAARDTDLHVVNGVELSVRWKTRDIHILGLMIDSDSSELLAAIKQQTTKRIERAHHIAARLLTLVGLEEAYVKAVTIAGHERVGRPHFAQVLVDAGIVKTAREAFQKYLVRGKGAYVASTWLELDEAVAAINHAGGQAVIAHPLKYQLTRTKLHELIKAFKIAGGAGIEVVSGITSMIDAQEMTGLCQRYDLLGSSGSDFHGEGWSLVGLGRQMPMPNNCTPIWHNWPIALGAK